MRHSNSSADSQHSCTVAILSSGTRQTLPLLLEALLPQLQQSDEVLLVNTAAQPGTQPLYPADQLIREVPFHNEQFDFASARNFAAGQSRGDIVAFTDDDCIPATDWLHKIRNALLTADAVGGACLPARPYKYPAWWSAEMSWMIGMSTPGFLRREADHYPATSNFAAHRELLLKHPFVAAPPNTTNLYHAGREDAEWWRLARLQGLRLVLLPDAIVYHDIPRQRLGWNYVLSRAHADGVAYWNRRQSAEMAQSLAPDLVHAELQLARSMLSLNRATFPSRYLWWQRQRSAFSAGRSSVPALGQSLWSLRCNAIRQQLANLYHCTRRNLLRAAKWPPVIPGRMLVSSGPFLGDTILLRPILDLFAQNYPSAHIDVIGSHPELLTGLRPNINAVSAAKAAAHYDAVIIPYHLPECSSTWRKKWSRIGTTFDWDAGFPRPRDYQLARRIVPKSATAHELQNLLSLFSIWPLAGTLESPRLDVENKLLRDLSQLIPFVETHPYITIHTSSGRPGKDWPIQRWCELAHRLSSHTRHAIVFLVAEQHAQELRKCADELPNPATVLLVHPLPIPQLKLLLHGAQLAIGLCSGPKHLAIALGTPTFTIYGESEPERWGAFNERAKHAFVRPTPAPLSMQEQQGIPAAHRICLISADAAWRKLEKHLSRLAPS